MTEHHHRRTNAARERRDERAQPDWDALIADAVAEEWDTPDFWRARNLLAVQREINDERNVIAWRGAARRLINDAL